MKPNGTVSGGQMPLRELRTALSVTAGGTGPYSFCLLLQVDDLRQQVCDLLLLAGGIFGLLGQFLGDAGNLHVGVPFDREKPSQE